MRWLKGLCKVSGYIAPRHRDAMLLLRVRVFKSPISSFTEHGARNSVKPGILRPRACHVRTARPTTPNPQRRSVCQHTRACAEWPPVEAARACKEREGVWNDLVQTGYQTTKPSQSGTQKLPKGKKHKPRPGKTAAGSLLLTRHRPARQHTTHNPPRPPPPAPPGPRTQTGAGERQRQSQRRAHARAPPPPCDHARGDRGRA